MKQRLSLLSGEPVAMPEQKPAPKLPDPGADVAALTADLQQLRLDLSASVQAQAAMQQIITETRARMETLQKLVEASAAKPENAPVVQVVPSKPPAYEVIVTARDEEGRAKKYAITPNEPTRRR